MEVSLATDSIKTDRMIEKNRTEVAKKNNQQNFKPRKIAKKKKFVEFVENFKETTKAYDIFFFSGKFTDVRLNFFLRAPHGY